MTLIEQLNTLHPVRKTRRQKADFRRWVLNWAEERGVSAREEKGGLGTNILLGDGEKAEVLITAHYDTPPVLPIPNVVTPLNVPMFLLYQVGVVLGMFALIAAVGALLGLLTKNGEIAAAAARLCCLGVFALMMFGPANPHNANDNTSGVAAVLATLEKLEPAQREKVAFVLFDNEEKGMLGSAAFARKHPALRKNALTLNLDCVGDGEHILLLGHKRARERAEWPLLEAAMEAQTGRELVIAPMEKGVYPSDQANFHLGAAFCACKKKRFVGYYCDKIHTKHDTICEQANLDYLSNGLADFVRDL